ncbi:MAG TPA: hypothetical protein VGN97_12415 [Mesorhizobium sp.]|jgi:transcriptional regulator with XRE-family HTH domain|nr:hypothetical protein [Mesorhizobium sp.]
MAVDFDKLERDLTEKEMALFMGVTMAMFSAIEAGANARNLHQRLQTHVDNFGVRRQADAKHVMEAFQAMVQSTLPK